MPRSVSEGFDTFLGWLEPLSSEHEKASSHKGSVKSSLENAYECTRLFETGSFGNGTGVRHHSDTDYFAVIPKKNISDNSSTALRNIRETLEATFWSTSGISVNCPAVSIPFGSYASETLEVTPCYFAGLVNTPEGEQANYGIPNCSGGWMSSSPSAHNAYVRSHDNRLSNRVKPLIQLIKAWKYYNDVPISSFHLELRTTKYAEGEKSIVYDIDLLGVFRTLNNIALASIQDPMGVSGYISACNSDAKKATAISKISTAFSRAEKAVAARESDPENAFYYWGLLFNNEFPSR